jgi:hypothetical protein
VTEPRTFPGEIAPEDNWLTSPPPPPPGASEPTVIVPPDPTETVPTAPGEPTPGLREVLAQRGEQLRRGLEGARRGLDGASPGWLWLAGGASLVAAYALAWLVSIISTVRHQPGLTAQGRLLTLLEPGDVIWAALGLFGVALVAAGRRLDHDAVTGRQAVAVLTALLIMAATILGAAVLGVLVELANFGHGIDPALAGIVARIAVVPVAGVAAAWAWHALGHHRS